jgi:anti-anti-sigma factor
MHIEFDVRGELCILRLKGRFLTGADTAYLRSKNEELKATGCRKVVADFREVPYVDSTGLGFIVGLYTSLRNLGGHFVMANANSRVSEVLDVTRLKRVIPLFSDEASAIAALNNPAEPALRVEQGV